MKLYWEHLLRLTNVFTMGVPKGLNEGYSKKRVVALDKICTFSFYAVEVHKIAPIYQIC